MSAIVINRRRGLVALGPCSGGCANKAGEPLAASALAILGDHAWEPVPLCGRCAKAWLTILEDLGEAAR